MILFVIAMTIDGKVLAIVMRLDDDDGNDDLDDGLNTWLALLDGNNGNNGNDGDDGNDGNDIDE